MEKFSTFNKDNKNTEVIVELDCCRTSESATFSVNNYQNNNSPNSNPPV